MIWRVKDYQGVRHSLGAEGSLPGGRGAVSAPVKSLTVVAREYCPPTIAAAAGSMLYVSSKLKIDCSNVPCLAVDTNPEVE